MRFCCAFFRAAASPDLHGLDTKFVDDYGNSSSAGVIVDGFDCNGSLAQAHVERTLDGQNVDFTR